MLGTTCAQVMSRLWGDEQVLGQLSTKWTVDTIKMIIIIILLILHVIFTYV